MKEYGVGSRDYLQRARQRLAEDTAEALFYAALELRSGIEARLQQYLEVWEHIAESKKKLRLISPLGKEAERQFQKGNKIIRVTLVNPAGVVDYVFYFTPVTSELRKRGEKLGDCLHTMSRSRIDTPGWRENFRRELEGIAKDLEATNVGTMLGPALIYPSADGTGPTVRMNVEIFDTEKPLVPPDLAAGDKVIFKVEYLEHLPERFEDKAYVWKPRNQ